MERKLPVGSRRFFQSLRQRGQGSPFFNVHGARGEARAFLQARVHRSDLVHVTYVENQLGLLSRYRSHLPSRLVGTVHQPPGWYRLRHKNIDHLQALDALIVMGREAAHWFEERVPGRVHYVPYSVDLEFFQPRASPSQSPAPRCLFAGRWLRDLPVLEGVIEEVLKTDPKIRFDLLVPHNDRKDDLFLRLAGHEQVFFHSGLSDDQLLKLYRGSSLLLLPCSTALATACCWNLWLVVCQ